MAVQVHTRPDCPRRLANGFSLAYLLLMALYLILRFTIQDRFWLMSQLNSFALLLFVPLPLLLLVSLFVRSRRAFAYLMPVVLVSLLWFVPRFFPRPQSPIHAAAPVLRIMSNNISHFNSDSSRVSVLALSQSPDVIFLQEVQRTTQRDMLAALESAFPHQSVQYDDMRQSMYAAANITFSRLPFVVSEQINPHIPEMPQIYRNVVEWAGQPIALYNIHLLSPAGGTRFTNRVSNYFVRYALDFDDSARNRQIDALLAFLAAEPLPYVVAGDFNTSDFSMTYMRLAARMHDSFAEAGIGLGGSWPVARTVGLPAFIPPILRIDYIWHSAGLRTVSAWQGHFTGSDHLPVFAEFSFP